MAGFESGCFELVLLALGTAVDALPVLAIQPWFLVVMVLA